MIGVITHEDKKMLTLTYDDNSDLHIIGLIIQLVGDRNSLLQELDKVKDIGVLND